MIIHSKHRSYSKVFFFLFYIIFVIACSAENSAGSHQRTTTSYIPILEDEGGSQSVSEAGTSNISSAGTTDESTTVIGVSGAGYLVGGTSESLSETCADQSVQVSRISPWVLFVIDRSSSMTEAYPGSTNRWQAIYDALMDPDAGVIARLQEVVHFGIMLYDGQGTCPRLVTVDPAPTNYDAIRAVYEPSQPGLITPTALALKEAYSLVPNQQQLLDRPNIGKQFVILCTDGEPNGCPSGFGGITTDFQGPIDEVTTAADKDIKTYVVSVASGGQEYQDFLEQLAQIGNTGSPAFNPTTKDDLVQQLTDIVGGAIGCEVELNGKVTVGSECLGYVELNSVEQECDGPDGWRLVDESHIELQGQACDIFKTDPNVILNATFPCDVVNVE